MTILLLLVSFYTRKAKLNRIAFYVSRKWLINSSVFNDNILFSNIFVKYCPAYIVVKKKKN